MSGSESKGKFCQDLNQNEKFVQIRIKIKMLGQDLDFKKMVKNLKENEKMDLNLDQNEGFWQDLHQNEKLDPNQNKNQNVVSRSAIK